MLDWVMKYADPAARLSMALIFIFSGVGKIEAFTATLNMMQAFGLPGIFLVPAIAFEIAAGVALVLGFCTRWVALALAGFSLVTALVFHRDFGDQIQQIIFLKNIAMVGGFLLIAKHDAPSLSLDGAFGAKRGVAS